MATPQFANLEQQATQRINPLLKGLSMLTGGIAGELTGTNEQIRQQRAARRALLQEELQKRDEQRALDRQLMINALQQGVGQLEGATLEERMADFQKKRLRQEIAGPLGRIFGLGQSVGPSPYEAEPAFQAGMAKGQLELAEKKAMAGAEEEIQRPSLEAQLRGFGATPRPGAPTGELRGQLERIRMETQSRIPMQLRQQSDVDALTDMYASNPDLKAFKGYTPDTIGTVAPVLAKTMMALARKELEQTAESKNKELAASATKEFSSILQLPPDERTKPENVARLNELSRYVPPVYTQNEKFLGAVGLGKPLDNNQLAEIKSYDNSLRGINRFISVLGEVAKTPGSIKKFQSSNFGTIANELRNVKSKFFTNDAERELASQLVQEYEGFVSGERKSLFGQSLTLGEGRKSDINFGTAADKNFFNRALQFIDRTVESDPVTFYLNSGKSVPDGTVKSIMDKRRKFDEFKSNPDVSPLFGVFGQGAGITPKTSRIQALTNEAAQLRQALGMTNAPSLKR